MKRAYIMALIPVIIIGAAIIGYFYFYKRAVNRSLQGDHRSSRLVSPSDVGLVLLGVFFIMSSVRNNAAISNLQNQLSNMNSQLHNISQQIDEIGKDHSHDFEWNLSVKDLYKQNGDYYARVMIEIIPEVVDGKTKVELHVAGKPVELNTKDHHYQGEFSVKIAEDPVSAYVYLENQNGGKREDLFLAPEKMFDLIFPSMVFTGSTTISSDVLNADLNVRTYQPENDRKIASAEVFVADGEKVLLNKKLEADKETEIRYKGKISKEDNARIYGVIEDTRGWKYRYTFLSGASYYETDHLTITDEAGQTVLSY